MIYVYYHYRGYRVCVCAREDVIIIIIHGRRAGERSDEGKHLRLYAYRRIIRVRLCVCARVV